VGGIRYSNSVQFATSALVLGLASAALAQTPPPAAPPAPTPPQATPPPAEDPKSIASITKGFDKLPGVFTLYRKKDGQNETIYAEIPESKLGQFTLLQVTNSGGTQGTNAEVAPGLVTVDLPLEFKKLDADRIILVTPLTKLRTSRPERQRLLDRSFPEEIVSTFPISGRSADGKTFLINLSSFMKSDVAELSSQLSAGNPFGGGGAGYGISNESSYIDKLKNLPENISYRVNHYLIRRSPTGGPRAFYLPVSYSWSVLPASDYRPRLGDPRVGYFTTYFNTSDNDASWDTGVNYIQRWNLKKRDPKATLSDPVKPITFWIDNATPPEYRNDIKTALLMWNPAFERVGIKNAIEVKQMPDDADWDIADVRYNVVRWTVDMPFAIALFRSNPLTGEIINASINMDAGFATGGGTDFDFHFDNLTPQQAREKFLPRLSSTAKDARYCQRAEAGKSSLALGLTANELVANSTMTRKEFIRQYIVEVVGHEMGHILGLRHNFAATNALPAKQLSDPAVVKAQGIGASIMDYNASNLFAIGKPGVDVYSQTIGTYDKWAIEYGYRDIAATTPEGERYGLNQIARKAGLPGLRYESDGSANGTDPSVQTFDLAQDNLDYFEKDLQTSLNVMKTAVNRGSQAGQSYFTISRRFQAGFRGYLNGVFGSLSIIGGVKLGNTFQGDPAGDLPAVPYPVERQRRALRLVTKYVLSPNALPVTPEALARITFNPNSEGNEGTGRAPNLLDSTLAIRSLAIGSLLDPGLFQLVANNEFRTAAGKDRITGDEIISEVTSATFRDLMAGTATNQISRSAQRSTVEDLIFLSKSSIPSVGDARISARSHLKAIRAVIGRGVRKTNAADAGHYADVAATIDRFFKPVGSN